MADHKREQILDAVVVVLSSLVPNTVDQVVRGRDTPIAAGVNKEVSISASEDEPVENSGWDNIYSNLKVNIDVHLRSKTEQIDTELNAARKEINIKMYANTTLALSFVNDLIESGASEPEIIDSGEMVMGLERITYNIMYNRSYTNPSL